MLSVEKFEHLIQKIDPQSRLVRAWALKGGVSAQVTAIEIERADGQRQKWVVRQHGAVDLSQNPQIAADEFKLLQLLQAAGLAVPAPYHVDSDIFETPVIVVDFIEGTPDFAPADLDHTLYQLAAQLAKIHSIEASQVSFLPEINIGKMMQRPEKLDDSLDEGRIRDALWPLTPPHQAVLLHGDYWPGNVLFQDGRLTTVIDWEDAKRGDPLADLGNARLEMVWAYGLDAMHTFTEHYRSMTTTDLTHLPFYDLCAALRPMFKIADWAGDAQTEQKMRDGHRVFVKQAIDALNHKNTKIY